MGGAYWPLRSLQRCETNPQQSDLVAGPDDITSADPHGDLVDLLQVVVELGQQAGGGVLLKAQWFTNGEEGHQHGAGVSVTFTSCVQILIRFLLLTYLKIEQFIDLIIELFIQLFDCKFYLFLFYII